MQIKVRLFASLRETFGYAERDMDIDEGLTLNDIWQLVTAGREPPAEVLMAVNMDYARSDAAVNDGDEVAFFPPVTGG